jgi:acyl carrier protein
MQGGRRLATISEVTKVLADVLQVGSRAEHWDSSTSLRGSIPELDSMAVVSVIGALEKHFGISVADDEISAEMFSTLGSLSAFIESKLHARLGNREGPPPPGL